MKVFCFTFIVYIVTLTVQPCQDFLAAYDDGNDTDVVQVNNCPVEAADDCSPFCICSCCSHAVADRCVFRSASAEPEAAIAASDVDTYTNPYANNFRNSIWQPPKA